MGRPGITVVEKIVHLFELVHQLDVAKSEVHHVPVALGGGQKLYQELEVGVTSERSAAPIPGCYRRGPPCK